ncbi:MAG: NADPH-dependent glutamate synthase [Chloroflexi bacterium]|nr:NADPH-dependent glutamate synthase [Chloroflexota bacterium]MCL5076113.1 NADPH-dependent glutamate synthase [Chloroflexota bacterium]
MPLNLNRQPMPAQDPEVRRKNFEEVALGYTEEMAIAEASRCLQCKTAPCQRGCPVGVDIAEFIKYLREGDLPTSARVLKTKNNLPAICGRVCPQETQCEIQCVYTKKGAPVAIGRLERLVADWELAQGSTLPEVAPPTGKRVAIVGSGPAGLTAAADLARLGHNVTIFEALHATGGVLVYGIPPFRLPRKVAQAEIEAVQRLGVEIRVDWVIGKVVIVDELLADGYRAVFLATGAGLPNFLGIPGENLNGVYSANEFLTRVNLMKAYLFPVYDTPIKLGKQVAVVGAGNVAMDAARTALRLGAQRVTIVYRRSRAEVPARLEELEHAEEEGIIFRFLTAPTRLLGDDKGWVVAIECQEMELGEPDASGRRRPIPKKGSEFVLETDQVIVAIGTSPNPLVPRTTKGLEITKHGTIVADPITGKTSKPGIWAGGDVVTGAATVIAAMGAGKQAAASINAYLMS